MGTIPGEANMEEELYGGIWSGKKPTVVYPCFYILMEKHKEMLGFNVTQYYFRNNSEVHAHWPMKDIWSGEIRKAGPRVHGGMLRNVVDATFGLCFVRNVEWKSWIMFCTE